MEVFVINLESRTDRWAQVAAECDRVGFTPFRIDACTPGKAVENSPFVAFNTSQKNALHAVQYRDEYPAIILEDDCVFVDPHHLWQAISELPPDWEVLYGGANIIGIDTIPFRKPERYSEHLFRLKDAWMTHCMIYSRKGVERILKEFSVTCGYNYDEYLRQQVMPDGNCYIVAPQIAYQRQSHSDIWNVQANFEHLFAEGNKLLV